MWNIGHVLQQQIIMFGDFAFFDLGPQYFKRLSKI